MTDRRRNDDTEIMQIGPHGAPWQGPPPVGSTPKYDRSTIIMSAIAAGTLVVLCGILAWFLAEVIPG